MGICARGFSMYVCVHSLCGILPLLSRSSFSRAYDPIRRSGFIYIQAMHAFWFLCAENVDVTDATRLSSAHVSSVFMPGHIAQFTHVNVACTFRVRNDGSNCSVVVVVVVVNRRWGLSGVRPERPPFLPELFDVTTRVNE